MNHSELIPHLFRNEYRKIISVLSKHFGFAQLEIAEDIASDTFLTATYTWGLNGVPENPTAWLYTVAKNKAANHLRRQLIHDRKIIPALSQASMSEETNLDLSADHISDSQLQMMFALCHPSLPQEAQVALCLRILCGFGIDEIASAFLTNKETINKRLARGKEKLRESNITIAIPLDSELSARMDSVLMTIYLLFNEGYHSLQHDKVIREELCLEAIRLCRMLVDSESTDSPSANALLALMFFHLSRFDSRMGDNNELILYAEQDSDEWNQEMIGQGVTYLHRSARGEFGSSYHLEAGIAYWSTRKEDTAEKWTRVLQLYDELLKIKASPIVALNRAYVVSKLKGRMAGIIEAESLVLNGNQFYHALLGELYTDIDNEKALDSYEKALGLARGEGDKRAIRVKMLALTNSKRL